MVMDFELFRHFWQFSPATRIFPCQHDRPTIPKGRTYVANGGYINLDWPPVPAQNIVSFRFTEIEIKFIREIRVIRG